MPADKAFDAHVGNPKTMLRSGLHVITF